MFRKAPHVKNLSVLRSTDRKKTIQQIVQLYDLQHVDPETRNSLLPEGAQSAKFTTNLNEPGTLYYDAQGLEPLWLRIIPSGQRQEVYVPTVYTMWRHPSLLKAVRTWDHVFTKLQGGADLMTPGLTGWSPQIKSGDVVQVLSQNKIPVAVGVAAFDIGQLSKAAGEKGKAIYLVHCYRDELWNLGSKSHPTEPSPEHDPIIVPERSFEELNLDVENDHNDLQLSHDEGNIQMEMSEQHAETQTDGKGTEERKPSGVDIDEAFKAAAIYGIYSVKMAEKRDSISFPLSSSTMVSNHLIPYLPEQYIQYTFKKTSWKKAATFLKKYLEREGIVKTKDRGGETIILSINWNHKLIAEFQPYTLSRRPAEQTDTKSTGPANSTPQIVEIRELYKPTGKVLRSILDSQSKSYGHGGAEAYGRKDELYNSVQIREALSEYINQNKELVDPRNPRLVIIDYILAPLLKPMESNIISMPRDKLLDRLLESSTSYFTITTESEAQTRKGKPPKISIVIEKRQGRKTVTRFWGLEAFFINPNEMAEELRNTCATSASVAAVPGSTPKSPVMEVMIQGPQTNAVIDALERRGVKKTSIVLQDKRK